VFEVPHDLIAHAEPEIKRIMESVVTLDVPLIVCTGSGADWNSAHQ
jgi:DNA polymerase-1